MKAACSSRSGVAARGNGNGLLPPGPASDLAGDRPGAGARGDRDPGLGDHPFLACGHAAPVVRGGSDQAQDVPGVDRAVWVTGQFAALAARHLDEPDHAVLPGQAVILLLGGVGATIQLAQGAPCVADVRADHLDHGQRPAPAAPAWSPARCAASGSPRCHGTVPSPAPARSARARGRPAADTPRAATTGRATRFTTANMSALRPAARSIARTLEW
jgi:hypothetical protein